MATRHTTLEALFAREDIETVLALARRHPEIAARLRQAQRVLEETQSDDSVETTRD